MMNPSRALIALIQGAATVDVDYRKRINRRSPAINCYPAFRGQKKIEKVYGMFDLSIDDNQTDDTIRA